MRHLWDSFLEQIGRVELVAQIPGAVEKVGVGNVGQSFADSRRNLIDVDFNDAIKCRRRTLDAAHHRVQEVVGTRGVLQRGRAGLRKRPFYTDDGRIRMDFEQVIL